MNQRTIKVLLSEEDVNTDILRFFITEESFIDINLNSDTCQTEIKSLFSELIRIAKQNDIAFELCIQDGYSKDLYKDVCSEYIKEIKRELEATSMVIRNELGVS